MEKREELNAIFQNESSTLYLGDCRLILGQIISKYKDRKMIIVTDPPFNIGYKYNTYKDNLYDYVPMAKRPKDLKHTCRYGHWQHETSVYIDAKLHNAIHKQMIELGWIK